MSGNFHPLTGDQVINAQQRNIFDTANPPVTNYYGLSAPGTTEVQAGWQIRRETLDSQGRTTYVKFAGGTLEYSQVMANYATLLYS